MSKLNQIQGTINGAQTSIAGIRKHLELILYTIQKDSITEDERKNLVACLREDSDWMRNLVLDLHGINDTVNEFAQEVNERIEEIVRSTHALSESLYSPAMGQRRGNTLWHDSKTPSPAATTPKAWGDPKPTQPSIPKATPSANDGKLAANPPDEGPMTSASSVARAV